MAAIYSDGTAHGEFYYITPIENLPSIFEHGILSHNRAQKFNHEDVSNDSVQSLRARKIVPNPAREAKNKTALTIHDYANVYFNGHNNMMFIIRSKNICVLRIDPRILTRDEVVVSKRNASRNDAEFASPANAKFSPESTRMLKSPKCLGPFKDAVEIKDKRKSVRQSEVLVPYQIPPSYLRGVYIKSKSDIKKIQKVFAEAKKLFPFDTVTTNPSLFFAIHHAQFTVPQQIADKHINKAHPTLDESLPLSDDESLTSFKEEAVFEMEE